MLLVNIIMLHVKINELHVNIIMVHVDIHKSHVDIIILHVDIIYRACRGQKYATIKRYSRTCAMNSKYHEFM